MFYIIQTRFNLFILLRNITFDIFFDQNIRFLFDPFIKFYSIGSGWSSCNRKPVQFKNNPST